MSKSLVDRLRECADEERYSITPQFAAMLREAADEIVRLTEERGSLAMWHDADGDHWTPLGQEIRRLEADLARARKVVEAASAFGKCETPDTRVSLFTAADAYAAALAAQERSK